MLYHNGMTIQTRARAIADRLIARHGGAAVLVRTEGGPQNPWDPPGGGDVLYPVTIIEAVYQRDYHPDGLIQAGDKLGTMAVPATVTPELSDRLRLDGVDFNIMELTAIQPAPDGVVVAFGFVARR